MCGAEDGGDVVGQGESDVMVGAEGGGDAVCRTLRGVSGCISWGGCGIYGKWSKLGEESLRNVYHSRLGNGSESGCHHGQEKPSSFEKYNLT